MDLSRSRITLQLLICLRWDVLRDVLNSAIQNLTQIVDSFHADILPVFQAVERAVRQVVLARKGIPILVGILQSFPKRRIVDHATTFFRT